MLKRVCLPRSGLGLVAAMLLSGAALAQDAGDPPDILIDDGAVVVDPVPVDPDGDGWVGIDPIEWECGDACIILIGEPGDTGETGDNGEDLGGDEPVSDSDEDQTWDCQSEICYSGAPTSGEEVVRPNRKEKAAKALKHRLGKARGGKAGR